MLSPTLRALPATAQVKEESGVPFGCVVQPLVPLPPPAHADELPTAEQLARCGRCFAYINPLCRFVRDGWRCALCGEVSAVPARYAASGHRRALPELSEYALELPVGASDEAEQRAPALVALVDVEAGDEFVELAAASLRAALRALAPSTLFGLVSVSSMLGVHALNSAAPALKLVPIDAGGGATVRLHDAVPLHRMLAPVGRARAVIEAAIESLASSGGCEGGAIGGADGGAAARGGRRCAMGAAVRELVSTWREAAPADAPVELLVLLGGAPNLGAGALAPRAPPPAATLGAGGSERDDDDGADCAGLEAVAAWERTQLRAGPAGDFYAALAEEAALLGAVIHVYVADCTAAMGAEGAGGGLASVRSLALLTGGRLEHYASVGECTLPQDVFKLLTRPPASRCLLRLRTGPEIAVGRSYGQLVADPRVENLYHLASCARDGAVAFDFEFVTTAGFSSDVDAEPTLQLAFLFSARRPAGPSEAGDESGESDGARGEEGEEGPADGEARCGRTLVCRRYLRVHTMRLRVARDVHDVRASVDTLPLMALLTRKVVRAAEDEGFREARLLLQDWLIELLTSLVAESPSLRRPLVESPAALPTQLRQLPRWVFALLRSPLLSSHTRLSPVHVDGDVRVALAGLYATLPPRELLTALYPALSAYADPADESPTELPLARSALDSSGCALFVLDALSAVYVYLVAADGAAELPPSKGSAVWRHIDRLVARRLRTPRVLVCHEGTPAAAQCERLLIEEGEQERLSFAHFWRFAVGEAEAALRGGL